jgi:hypothetical protein
MKVKPLEMPRRSAWRDGTPARARVNVLEERRSAWGSAPYSGARGLYMYGIRLSRARLMVIHRLCHLSLVDDLDGLFSMTARLETRLNVPVSQICPSPELRPAPSD